MIDANAEALARKERDDAQANLEWETAKADGEREAREHEALLSHIISIATDLSAKIKALQSKDKIWDCILDGMTNYDLENHNTVREVETWIEKYSEEYAEKN